MDDSNNSSKKDDDHVAMSGSKRRPAPSHNSGDVDSDGVDGDDDFGGGGEDGHGNTFELDPDRRREVRKMRRVMANRRSARESRERRKKLLADLQESVEGLTSENTTLTKENLSLRRELAALIEQSGGAAQLSMIPNIQALLQSTQSLSGINIMDGASGGGGGAGGNDTAGSGGEDAGM